VLCEKKGVIFCVDLKNGNTPKLKKVNLTNTTGWFSIKITWFWDLKPISEFSPNINVEFGVTIEDHV
jgi:hypothetical protein